MTLSVNDLPNWRRGCDEFRPESEGRSILIDHFLELETDPQYGALNVADKLDVFLIVVDSGIAGGSLFGEKENHGVKPDALGIAVVADVAGRYSLFVFPRFEKGVGPIELLILAKERRQVH